MAMILWKFDNVHKMSNRRIEKETKKQLENISGLPDFFNQIAI